jgi:hypothetical protein
MDTLQACTTKDKVQEAWRIFGNRKKRPNLLLVAFVKLEANVHEKNEWIYRKVYELDHYPSVCVVCFGVGRTVAKTVEHLQC